MTCPTAANGRKKVQLQHAPGAPHQKKEIVYFTLQTSQNGLASMIRWFSSQAHEMPSQAHPSRLIHIMLIPPSRDSCKNRYFMIPINQLNWGGQHGQHHGQHVLSDYIGIISWTIIAGSLSTNQDSLLWVRMM